jgi:hypothetical protein
MDTATLTAIVQAIVTIVTTLSGVWAIFTKKNADLEQKLNTKIASLETELRYQRQNRDSRP